MCEIEITAEGLRHLSKLLEKVRHATLKSVLGPIAENPNRVGKPLVGELERLWSVPRGDYRDIYEIFEDEQIVLIHRVQHRRDACRPRSLRPTTRPRALRARNDAKPCQTMRDDEHPLHGKGCSSLWGGSVIRLEQWEMSGYSYFR
ncbi:hypothetical protein MNBD_ACTINO01-165 [hydrothermal vent metagenome]|uniref:Type II toxin-antitoxin system RelE/ParE family toxin n=1 Tax=hydrothermal vent metagenome TaxID=652676 RepID=A0A3B0SC84_9ZZZZ